MLSNPEAFMSSFPVPVGRFWAKLHPRENPQEWHPLIAHSADVAAVLEQLLLPNSTIGQRLAGALEQEELTPAQRARLIFLAVLHDMGKTGHGFQTKARPQGERGRYLPWQRGHVQTLLHSTDYAPLKALIGRELLPAVDKDLRTVQDLFFAAIAHHGRPWQPKTDNRNDVLWKPDSSRRDPLAEMRRLIAHGRRWSGLDNAPAEELPRLPPRFTHLFAGALTLADWIGSTVSAFPFAPQADSNPDSYWSVAREQAADACARIGLVPRTTAVSLAGMPLLETLFPDTFRKQKNQPTDLQKYISEMLLPEPGTRLLIESETGSGKTEAALTLYARLRAAGLVSGLMFALPTRATASAMYDRVKEALEGMYGSESRPTAALAVGGRQPRTESSEELVAEQPQTWPDPGDRELANWASSSNKKFFAAEIVVGTLDQVLLGGLPVKHAHLRLAALSRHLLVVDELHSYDRYMAEVLTRVLELHTGAGGVALFMSATLSDAERQRYGGGPEHTRHEAEQLPYPTVSVCQRPGAGWRDMPLAPHGRPKTVHWETTAEDDALHEAIVAAQEGARVCILCNTVNRARANVTLLRDAAHDALLWRPDGSDKTPPYHSRYTQPDRLKLDEEVRKRFGKAAATTVGGTILVSTQVVEQSLDVDFDLLITDLCPVDVLLQRIGRLHRHRKRDPHRPDRYRQPRVLVIAPEEGSFTPHLKRRALDLGWGQDRPYPNYADGELTLHVIYHYPSIEIPRDNRTLVEAVYHCEVRDPLWNDAAWSDYLVKATGDELKKQSHGRSMALDFRITYAESALAFDNAQEQRIRTRLGDETVRIELPGEVRPWYAGCEEAVQNVDLPVWALPKGEGDQPGVDNLQWDPEPDGTARFRLADHTYRYSPDGWEWVREKTE
jgi:CRISPR-associated endonuclease/helicase Cas3